MTTLQQWQKLFAGAHGGTSATSVTKEEKSVVLSTPAQGWKIFRYCPAVAGEPRSRWTKLGQEENKCFGVVGQLHLPKNTTVVASDNYKLDEAARASEASLVEGSLERREESTFFDSFDDHTKNTKLSLTDENGVVSSRHDPTFEYPQGKLVKPARPLRFTSPSWSRSGIHFCFSRQGAHNWFVGTINKPPAQW